MNRRFDNCVESCCLFETKQRPIAATERWMIKFHYLERILFKIISNLHTSLLRQQKSFYKFISLTELPNNQPMDHIVHIHVEVQIY